MNINYLLLRALEPFAKLAEAVDSVRHMREGNYTVYQFEDAVVTLADLRKAKIAYDLGIRGEHG